MPKRNLAAHKDGESCILTPNIRSDIGSYVKPLGLMLTPFAVLYSSILTKSHSLLNSKHGFALPSGASHFRVNGMHPTNIEIYITSHERTII